MRAQSAIKNTTYLYLRTGLQTLIALFSIRIILNGLGHEDYGLYNTIGSIVVFSAFINSALSSATQRYLSFYLGRKDYFSLSKVFAIAIKLHRIIAILTFVIAEIVGIVFISYYMSVESFRKSEMLIVLQFSLIALCLNILVVPYRSMLTSYERFDVISIVAVLESILRLGSAYLVLLFSNNRIIIYAVAIMLISYVSYAYIYYKNKRYAAVLEKPTGADKGIMKEMISFSGWNFLGGFGFAVVNQLTNMVLNVFCGAIINAAQAVANQVNTYVSKFVQDFMMAIHPQIVKSFSSQDNKYLDGVVYSGIKMSFFLIYALTIPLIFNLDFILTLWLKNPPVYVNEFVIILLINSCVLSLTGTISMLIEANGKIKYTQICYTSVMIVSSVIAWVLISKTGNPMYAYYSILFIGVASLVIRLFFARKYKLFRFREYMRVLITYILPFCVCYYVSYYVPFLVFHLTGWSALILSCLISMTFLPIYGWLVFLSKNERDLILNISKSRKK